MELTTKQALTAYAEMMNSCDSTNFEKLLADDLVSTSQAVLTDITSKTEFITYIRGKLQTIKQSNATVYAELGELNAYGHSECVVIAQGNKDNLVATAFITVKDNKVKQIDLCSVPPPSQAKRSGIYPKIKDLNSQPKIQSIFICPKAGMPMTELSKTSLIANKGIDGDRYASCVGTFSKSINDKVRDITLIARIGIDTANQLLSTKNLVSFLDNETRRNIVIDAISSEELNNLVGKIFYLGNIRLKGTELCDPCSHPSKLTGKDEFKSAFTTRGGIRAQVLDTGEISVGDFLSQIKSK